MEKKKEVIDYSKMAKERIVTIADLIHEIVRRFWIVIILAVVFAVLLGGYRYIADSKAAAAMQSDTENTADISLSNLSEEEQNEVNNILLIEENMLQQQEYAENSILMKIDPYNESVATLQYYFNVDEPVDSAEQDYRTNLLDMYQSYIENGALISDLKEQGMDLDAQYLEEIISCEVQPGAETGDVSEVLLLGSQMTSFDVKVINENSESCKELADKIVTCMQNYQEKLNTSIGSHELILMDQSYSQMVDNDLMTYKYDRVNSIASMQERIDTLKENLSAEQLNIVEQSIEHVQSESLMHTGDSSEETTAPVSINKKYVAVGALAGIILACLFIVVTYIMRGTINKAEDLQYLYNMRILGEIVFKSRKNPFLSVWNKLLGHGDKVMPLKEQLALLETNLLLTCKKKQIQKMLISGGDENGLNCMKEVFQKLGNQGIEVEYVSDLLASSVALQKLSEYDTVILVEHIRKSQYSDIIKQIEICSEQEVELLGAIVLHA